MIFDSLKNCAEYYGISPRIKQAFELFAQVDWTQAEPGKQELDGKNIVANVQVRGLKTKEEAKLEVHDKYIDIQIHIAGADEAFGWADRSTLKQPKEAFNAEKDIQFFDDEPQTYVTLRPGQFTILMPEDAHAPLVGEGEIRKVILKVLK
ncbi:MAG: YhcH/YjgK/YiaL family protein [Rikenellaceae bacterium]|nr:YhcH/YjgK/YiaL family protein [Rikenellaceae bacterium]